MDKYDETVFERVQGDEFWTVSTGEAKWKNRLVELAKSHPEINIVENLDGSIYSHIPKNWLKITPPRKLSEEQRLAAAERLKAGRMKKNV